MVFATLAQGLSRRNAGTCAWLRCKGKFDSNWSLYFLGYPVLLGVSLNLAVSLYLANGSARVGWFILLMGAAAFLCIVLRQIEICDERVISAATVAAIEGRQVHMLPVE
jgi:hypothetical protein